MKTGSELGLKPNLLQKWNEMGNRIRKSSIGLVFAGLLLTQPAGAQDSSNPELKKEIQALSDAVKGVQKDVQEIKLSCCSAAARRRHRRTLFWISEPPLKGQGKRQADDGGVFGFSVPVL